MAERLAVDLVAIPEEIGWRGVFGEGVHDLLGRPECAVGCSVTLKWTMRRRW